MSSYRLGTFNNFYWGFKPVLSSSKPHTFSTVIEKENENMCIYPLLSSHLEHEQYNRKVKKVYLKDRDEKENPKYKGIRPVNIII